MNVECGKHEQSLIQVGPGASRVVYDGYQLAKTIEGVNSTTKNDLQKWALISQYANYFTVFRISFQPWGPEYTKKRLTGNIRKLSFWKLISNLLQIATSGLKSSCVSIWTGSIK